MLYNAGTDDTPLPGDDGIVQEAHERYQATEDWQGTNDQWEREDIKFANADCRNNFAWDKGVYDRRTSGQSELPCLTINNTRVHNDLIINQLSKSGYGIKVRPTGGKASYKSAEVMQSIIRRIEYISKGSAQYRRVAEHQVDGGIGYILIETAYVSERSNNQDIYLKAARDPTGVRLDPWIREPDGSDANWGFVIERMARKEFNRKYPKFKNKVGTSALQGTFALWLTDKEIVLAKYYRKKGTDDRLIEWKDEQGDVHNELESEIKDEAGNAIFKQLLEDIKEGKIDGRTRKVTNNTVEWFLIAGDQVVDRGEWAGKYIPICRCVGRELVIDGTLDRKGHTRPLVHANQMLNYSASSSVSYIYGQTKTAWTASARAVEGQEGWDDANVNTRTVLTYNDVDDEAVDPALAKIDPPKRIDPPQPSPAFETAMQNAERQMMMVSGQFQAQMGENDGQSANSGVGINNRKEQGDTATYHFVEHRSDMLRFIGMQLLDLIPKIYDTERALHVFDGKNEKYWINIQPNQTEALDELKHEKEDEEAVKYAFNPGVGEYECVSDPGPSWATQREEAWNAMSMLFQANKELAASAADVLFKYGDFPGAEELMQRLQKEIKANKPYLFDDDAPEPAMLALKQVNEKLTKLNTELMEKLAANQLKLKGKEEQKAVNAYDAETKRIVGLGNTVGNVGLDILKPVIRQVLSEMLGNGLSPEQHMIQAGIDVATHESEIASDTGGADLQS